ncbi:helix-turn-helix transcriptional regulator [Pseudomonas lalucatii]|uniref:Helix-turn-helix transcriptional regulator n=1 Tax=Pseudomonas lalucatii TaxID=1424203 RepID=A0ABS5PVP0_9PSED|nr:TetR/AcrR family transcriptional regulator [Pseudomonas lalucatii]MBS7660597.1 helix-turn-helix transcriptional regulator [Pseudomonas lalucatii]MBS7691318.1 helix-turn-helix transcriptional regulator [Pseudomonas lalucatii]MBS7724562.1 helix-turn-helix transcriptional regulator [Pseudomonas lalucatii]QVM87445.1 helix-turn-helix transcriptional regulator [Pseudomonas lalucatii]
MPATQRLADPSRYQATRSQALSLFAERGFSRVSMRDLAEHLGIKPGSIYHHIESKEALLFELIEELYEQLLHGARQLSRRAATPAEQLHGLLEAHLRLHASMGAHFRLAEYDGHCLASEQQARIGELRGRYEHLLIQGAERFGGQPLGSSRRAALSSIVSLLNQLPAWLETPGLSAPARLELLHDMVMSALRAALRAPQD